MIYGIILLIVILKFPGGLYPYIQRFAALIRGKRKQTAAAAGKE